MKQLNFVLIFIFSFTIINAQKLMGFTDADAAKQLDWEKQFDGSIKRFSNSNHHISSKHPKDIIEEESSLEN